MPKSVLRAVLERMRFTLHATRRAPYGASRLVQAMSAWSVKTRRAPSRHSRDATVYGHATTVMHKLSTPPPTNMCPCGTTIECRTYIVGKCEIYKDVLEKEMRKLDVCDMEEFGRLESSEKTITILGDRWWPQTAKQDGDRISKQFLCISRIWKNGNERSNVGRKCLY